MKFGAGGRLRWAVAIIALLTCIPLVVVVSALAHPDPSIWQHLLDHVLAELLINTIWLVAGVTAGVLLLGVPLAWLTAVYSFPGQRFFGWALMLPLAMPAYVLAFVQVGLLDYAGPLQTALRGWLGEIEWFPEIRSRGGVILILSLGFYPYVYLLARNAFLTQGRRLLEVSQSMGLSRTQSFVRVALPLARPWIAAGLLLTLMETLADFGAVSVLNYNTFTTAIYKAWFSFFSLPAAAQLASILMVIVFVMVLLEQRSREHKRYAVGRDSPLKPIRLQGWKAFCATAWSSTVLLCAFGIPLMQLIYWACGVIGRDFDTRYWGFIGHTLMLAGIVSSAVALCALLLAYAQRRHADRFTRTAVKLATLGYAIPGSVLAVGVFIPIAWLDNQMIELLQLEATAILKGSIAIMILALAARFMAVGFNPVESAMQRISRNQEMAARSLGASGLNLVYRLHVPLLRGGLFTGILLVFVDVMKEMPITLMTRPFGWDTLAVRIFEMTSEGEWQRAALPSLVLILSGLLPVMLLARQTEHHT